MGVVQAYGQSRKLQSWIDGFTPCHSTVTGFHVQSLQSLKGLHRNAGNWEQPVWDWSQILLHQGKLLSIAHGFRRVWALIQPPQLPENAPGTQTSQWELTQKADEGEEARRGEEASGGGEASCREGEDSWSGHHQGGGDNQGEPYSGTRDAAVSHGGDSRERGNDTSKEGGCCSLGDHMGCSSPMIGILPAGHGFATTIGGCQITGYFNCLNFILFHCSPPWDYLEKKLIKM